MEKVTFSWNDDDHFFVFQEHLIWLYPEDTSMNVKALYHVVTSTSKSMRVTRKSSLGQALFRSQTSMRIRIYFSIRLVLCWVRVGYCTFMMKSAFTILPLRLLLWKLTSGASISTLILLAICLVVQIEERYFRVETRCFSICLGEASLLFFESWYKLFEWHVFAYECRTKLILSAQVYF